MYTLNPCISFRVFGSPSDSSNGKNLTKRKIINIFHFLSFSDMNFSSAAKETKKMSGREYIIITLCSLCLGILYLSIFLYIKKKKWESNNLPEQKYETNISTDVIFGDAIPNMFDKRDDDRDLSDSSVLDSHQDDRYPNEASALKRSTEATNSKHKLLLNHLPKKYNNAQLSLASINQDNASDLSDDGMNNFDGIENDTLYQFQNINEIRGIDTVDSEENINMPEDYVEKGLVHGHLRKKLYFNPAYFEPDLLASPPPSAIEFLSKIREVISVAKSKMSAKRYQPSLLVIPEESNDMAMSEKGSIRFSSKNYSVSQSCDGCPGCDGSKYMSIGEKSNHKNCKGCGCENKQNSIKKWLENVPLTYDKALHIHNDNADPECNETVQNETIVDLHEIPVAKNKISEIICGDKYQAISINIPDMISEAVELEANLSLPDNQVGSKKRTSKKLCPSAFRDLSKKKDCSFAPFVPTPDYSTYNKKTLRMLKEHQPDSPIYSRKSPSYLIVDYETDSLEKINSLKSKKCFTPTSFHSQSSPSLSTALPLEEEVEISNALYSQIEGVRKESKGDKKIDETSTKIMYDTPMVGSMTIELQNCANEYDLTDSDQFEPDTLDRKLSNMSNTERQNLMAKTFQNSMDGSLRAIEIEKLNAIYHKETVVDETEKGRLLTLELKHAKRQRPIGYASLDKKLIPPDVVTSNTCRIEGGAENQSFQFDNGEPLSTVYEKCQLISNTQKPSVGKTLRGNHLDITKYNLNSKNSIEHIELKPFQLKHINSIMEHDTDFDQNDNYNQKKTKDFKNAWKKIVGMASKIHQKDDSNEFQNYTTLEEEILKKDSKKLDCDVERGKVKNIVQQLNDVERTKSREQDSGYISAESNESRKIRSNFSNYIKKDIDIQGFQSDNKSITSNNSTLKGDATFKIHQDISHYEIDNNSSSESDFESTIEDVCESGAESIETSSVFFKNTRVSGRD